MVPFRIDTDDACLFTSEDALWSRILGIFLDIWISMHKYEVAYIWCYKRQWYLKPQKVAINHYVQQ